MLCPKETGARGTHPTRVLPDEASSDGPNHRPKERADRKNRECKSSLRSRERIGDHAAAVREGRAAEQSCEEPTDDHRFDIAGGAAADVEDLVEELRLGGRGEMRWGRTTKGA